MCSFQVDQITFTMTYLLIRECNNSDWTIKTSLFSPLFSEDWPALTNTHLALIVANSLDLAVKYDTNGLAY